MKLSQCATLITERIEGSLLTPGTYLSTENMLPNLGGFVPSAQNPNFPVTAYRKEDILLSNIRPYFKKIVFAKSDGGSSNDVLCIRVNKAKVLPQYLFYCLCADSFFNYYVSNCKGTKMPRGDKQALLNYDVPEFSLDQQRHIVDVIASLLRESS